MHDWGEQAQPTQHQFKLERVLKGIMRNRHLLKSLLIPAVLMLHACSTVEGPTHTSSTYKHKKVDESEAIASVADDGPPEDDLDVAHIPNATPQIEPISRYGNPAHYEVFGQRYKTMGDSLGYEAEGTASWYGKKFHGQRTSSGEPYDMYAMTAAHRSLPLPTYAKITNVKNGKEVIVKINDRGPFVKDRLIDLSYAAAKKLGIHATGTGKVKICAIDPVAWNKQQKTLVASADKTTKVATAKKKAATTVAQKSEAKPTQVAQKSTTKPIQVAQKTTTPMKPKTDSSAKAKAAPTKAKPVQVAAKSSAATNKQLYIQLGAFNKEANAQQLASRAGILTQALNNVDVHVLPNKVSDKQVYKVRVGPLKDKQQAQKLQKELLALENSASAKLIYE
uniref:Endolytic peptidoglycan transglycosylase RlpA n=1 Tax=Candidatus Berkiella aquae TaxID=295108 RepID=A0A0Q9YXL7_9GAMM